MEKEAREATSRATTLRSHAIWSITPDRPRRAKAEISTGADITEP